MRYLILGLISIGNPPSAFITDYKTTFFRTKLINYFETILPSISTIHMASEGLLIRILTYNLLSLLVQ